MLFRRVKGGSPQVNRATERASKFAWSMIVFHEYARVRVRVPRCFYPASPSSYEEGNEGGGGGGGWEKDD